MSDRATSWRTIVECGQFTQVPDQFTTVMLLGGHVIEGLVAEIGDDWVRIKSEHGEWTVFASHVCAIRQSPR